MTGDRPLDPDEVTCPTCGQPPAKVCRQPNGKPARAIHVTRRRAAERGEIEVPDATPTQTPRPRKTKNGGKPFDSTAASAAAKKSAQARRRRSAEVAAETERLRAEAEARALTAEAEKLADDAVRYAKDRAILRRHTLDAALKSATRLIEGLDGIQLVRLDDDGRPIMVAEEYEDREGRTKQRQVPDIRGAWSAANVERLAKVAASALNSLRLEEGKPTGITSDTAASGAADALGEQGVAELIAWAQENLPGAT